MIWCLEFGFLIIAHTYNFQDTRVTCAMWMKTILEMHPEILDVPAENP